MAVPSGEGEDGRGAIGFTPREASSSVWPLGARSTGSPGRLLDLVSPPGGSRLDAGSVGPVLHPPPKASKSSMEMPKESPGDCRNAMRGLVHALSAQPFGRGW
jgi:hypothetical protein